MNFKTTDFKRNSSGRARIYECTFISPPPPIKALVTPQPRIQGFSFDAPTSLLQGTRLVTPLPSNKLQSSRVSRLSCESPGLGTVQLVKSVRPCKNLTGCLKMCLHCLFLVVEKPGTSCYQLIKRLTRPADWQQLHSTSCSNKSS